MSGFGDMMMDDSFSDPMEYMDYLEEQYYNSQSDLYDNDDDWHDECAEKEYDKEEYEKQVFRNSM
jgi:hypothetical protein